MKDYVSKSNEGFAVGHKAAEPRIMDQISKECGDKYRNLYDRLDDSFALYKIVFDEDDLPRDYLFVDVNTAFEAQSGLTRDWLIGKSAFEVFAGTEHRWKDYFYQAAVTGISRRYQTYSDYFDRYYSSHIFIPNHGYLAALHTDITTRVENENKIMIGEARLQGLLKLYEARHANAEELVRYALEEVVQLTGSNIALLVNIERNRLGRAYEIYLESTNQGMKRKCFPYIVEKMEIWKEMLDSRQPVIMNENRVYDSSNAHMKRVMGVPLYDEDVLVAIAMVADKDDDYDFADMWEFELYMKCCWEIVQHKQAQLRLKESEEYFRSLMENSLDIICVLDKGGTIQWISPSFEDALGFTTQEVLNKKILKFIHPEDQMLARELSRQLIARQAGKYPVEMRVLGKDKTWHVLEGKICLFPKKIDTTGIIINARDVSELKSMHQKLREAEARYHKLLSESGDGLNRVISKNEIQRQIKDARSGSKSTVPAKIQHSSENMQGIIEDALKYHNDRSIPVLILGETGTGKEVIAKLIHLGDGQDSDAAFVALNCSAINRELFESEFFGYESGSFTGSLRGGQKGKFDLAKGGTLFLDEIAEIPLELQSKLLRVIESKEFYRVGGVRAIQTDVRIICATNVDLVKRVQQGSFRRDLYYRLGVGLIQLLPLRERKEEILPLTLYFLQEFSHQREKNFRCISPEASEILITYPWPGNIRELKNLVEWVTVMYNDYELKPLHLTKIMGVALNPAESIQGQEVNNCFHAAPVYKRKITAEMIKEVSALHKGNKTKTASHLGISRPTLYKYMELYGL